MFGEFGDYKPLPSSVDAKLQAICESLASSQKQGNAEEEPCSSVVEDVKPNVKVEHDDVAAQSNYGEVVYTGFEDFKVESDESSAGSSSPESGVTFFDFSDYCKWDETGSLGLEKYPSVEIDWAAI